MRRSMRGERGHGRLTRRAGVSRDQENIERPGMMRLTDPGGTCDIAITSCLGCDRWWWSASSPDIYMWTVISLAPGPHITGHKDIDPGQAGTDVRYWFPGSVCGASQLCVCCCVSAGGVYLLLLCPTLRPGSMLAPPPSVLVRAGAVIRWYYRDHHSITVSNKSHMD